MRMNFHPSGENLFDRLQDALGHVHQQISNEQEQRNRQKVYLALSCDFYKPSMPDVMSQPPPVFNTEAVAIFPATDVVELVQKFYISLITEIENYERCGSGWVLNSFQMLDIHFLHYNPLRASSFIPMPEKFHQKKGYTNVQNEDQRCFEWSILSHLYPASRHPERVSSYKKHLGELNMEGISIPVRICDIGKFEKNNPDISITLFGLTETHDLFPVRVAETQKEHHIQLLYLSNTRTSHYVLVKSLSALVYHQISKHKKQKYF